MEDLKKLLAESTLSDELKTAYGEVLDQMTEDEKAEFMKIIEDANKVKDENEEQRLEKLARMNVALEKHLKDVLRDEQKYIRTEFEGLGKKEDAEEMNNLEQEINNLF